MADNLLHGNALREYNNLEGLLNIYSRDAIDMFLIKYPMLKKYKQHLSCDEVVLNSSDGVAFEIKFDGNVTIIHAIVLAKTGDMTEWNHKIGNMKTVQTAGPVVVTVRLELERFYFAPLSGEIFTM
ncbi:MAG: hypothetical protein DRP09_16575 [Candidatus Thorarchaeota archaeon]|nr:MAG: hypothetical protein DRP09_16575 [Candidatus Thorarchaeota archaeon]